MVAAKVAKFNYRDSYWLPTFRWKFPPDCLLAFNSYNPAIVEGVLYINGINGINLSLVKSATRWEVMENSCLLVLNPINTQKEAIKDTISLEREPLANKSCKSNNPIPEPLTLSNACWPNKQELLLAWVSYCLLFNQCSVHYNVIHYVFSKWSICHAGVTFCRFGH